MNFKNITKVHKTIIKKGYSLSFKTMNKKI